MTRSPRRASVVPRRPRAINCAYRNVCTIALLQRQDLPRNVLSVVSNAKMNVPSVVISCDHYSCFYVFFFRIKLAHNLYQQNIVRLLNPYPFPTSIFYPSHVHRPYSVCPPLIERSCISSHCAINIPKQYLSYYVLTPPISHASPPNMHIIRHYCPNLLSFTSPFQVMSISSQQRNPSETEKEKQRGPGGKKKERKPLLLCIRTLHHPHAHSP